MVFQSKYTSLSQLLFKTKRNWLNLLWFALTPYHWMEWFDFNHILLLIITPVLVRKMKFNKFLVIIFGTFISYNSYHTSCLQNWSWHFSFSAVSSKLPHSWLHWNDPTNVLATWQINNINQKSSICWPGTFWACSAFTSA